MTLPDLPSTPTQALVAMGLGLIIAIVLWNTRYYEEWEDARAEANKQAAILSAEQEYFDRTADRTTDVYARAVADLAIRAAEAAWWEARAADRRGRWEKTNYVSVPGFVLGLVAVVVGMVPWWRRQARSAAPREE